MSGSGAGERSPADRDAGIAMTEAIMDACAPIIDGQDTDLVIEAMGAAFSALLAAGQISPAHRRLVLARYAERILEYGELL